MDEFIKLKCIKDNVINSYYQNSNQGYSNVLSVYSIPCGQDKREISRALLHFDLTDYQQSNVDLASMSAILKLYNVYNTNSEPKNAIYDICLLTNSWEEGNGQSTSTTGISNWNQRDAVNFWDMSGGDYNNSITSIAIGTGDEDFSIDIKDSLIAWSTSAIKNYGIIIKLSDALESPTGSLSGMIFSPKLIYGRETNTIFKPSIEISWKNKFTDNSADLYFGSTGELLFYNKGRKGYIDLNGTNDFPGYLSLTGSASTSLTAATLLVGITGSRISKGIYKFVLPIIPLSGATLTATYANWTLTNGLSAATDTISKKVFINSPVQNQSLDLIQGFTLSVINFKDKVTLGDKIEYSVFIKKITDTLLSLTAGSTAINSFIATEGYWKVVDDKTGVDIYPWMDLDYNDTVNFFTLDTKYLESNRAYRIIFKIIECEKEFYFDIPKYYYCFYLYNQ